MAENKYRNLDNEEYWIKRSEERVSKHWSNLKNVEKALAKQFRIALEDIRSLVSDLYTQYARETGLSYQDAIKELNGIEIGDYQAKLNRLLPLIKQTQDPFLIAEFQKLQAVVKLNRFQALMGQVDARLLLMGYEQQTLMDEWLSELYSTNYYQAIYQLQVGTGLGTAFALLNDSAIQTAITMAWSGSQFSDRIWDNKTKLVKELREAITQGIIKGEPSKVVAKRLMEKMDSSYSNALRLVRTETAYVINESTFAGYKETGIVSQYKILATLDLRTSSICRKQDGKIYRLEDRQVSLTAPPFHPNCRTDVYVIFDEKELEKSVRIARGEDGKNYYVPANLSYNEWFEQYIKQGVPT